MSLGDPSNIPTRTGARPPVRVFVCGESARGDDAAALLAVERLPEDARTLGEIEVCGQLDVQQLVDLPPEARCLVVDAAVGVPAGRVVVVPLAQVARRSGPGPHSSHSIPPDEVLSIAEIVRGSLPEGSFVGLGARSFGLGEGVSPEVDAALDDFAGAVADEIRRLAAS